MKHFWTLTIFGLMASCTLAPTGLYEMPNRANEYPNIKGFASLSVLDGPTGDEFWVSKEARSCFSYSVSEEGTYTFQWDKPGGGCDWVGMGVGWDQWSGKNMAAIVDEAAMRLVVRLPRGAQSLKTLPLAFGFEDYSGRQAWMGMSSNYVVDGPITDQWTVIDLPMGLFNWTEMDCDPSNIKQFITQFEGDGTFELQKMEVVPFAGSLRKKVSASWTPNGDLLFNLRVGDAIVTGVSTPDSLILTGRFEDREPFVNTKQGTELWNGDALEVAFSAQPVTSKRPRTNFLFSDVHLGLSLGERPEVVNFRTGALIPVKRDILVDEGGALTLVSWKLPWASLKREGWQLEGRYLLEVARDQGNAKGRTEQIRWNSGEAEGFHLNPGLWGELIVPKKQLAQFYDE